MYDLHDLPIARSKPVIGLAVFLLLGALFFGFCAGMSLQDCFVNGYAQFFPFLFGSLLGGMGLLCLWGAYLASGHFEVYSDRIVVRSGLRNVIKTLRFRDIVRAEEMLNDDGAGRRMEVWTGKGKYAIARDDNEYDYDRIKAAIIAGGNITGMDVVDLEGLGKSVDRSDRKLKLGLYTAGMLLYSWIIYAMLSSYFRPNAELDSLQFSVINGAIMESPETHSGHGRGDYSYVRFRLKNHPGLVFEMQNGGYDATYRNELYRIQPNDSVGIKIALEDFQKKVSREQPLSTWDKIDASHTVMVYELWDEQHKYLSLENYRLANKHDGQIGFYISFVIMALLIWTARGTYKVYRSGKCVSNGIWY